MATADQLEYIHRNIAWWVGPGAAASILGLSSYFMTIEYKDLRRVDTSNIGTSLRRVFQRRHRWAMIVAVVSLFVYLVGTTLLTLGISFHRNERQTVPQSVAEQLELYRDQQNQPSLNEPALLSGAASLLIVSGLMMALRQFRQNGRLGWPGALVYGGGWLMQAFAAATETNRINSVNMQRFGWTLPGSAAIVLGTYMIPWQLEHNYISGPAWPLISMGYLSLSLGTAFARVS